MFPARSTHRARPFRPNLWHRIRAALILYRQRQHLGRLDAHMLRDIGLTPEQAQAEADLPLWRAPAHWVEYRR